MAYDAITSGSTNTCPDPTMSRSSCSTLVDISPSSRRRTRLNLAAHTHTRGPSYSVSWSPISTSSSGPKDEMGQDIKKDLRRDLRVSWDQPESRPRCAPCCGWITEAPTELP